MSEEKNTQQEILNKLKIEKNSLPKLSFNEYQARRHSWNPPSLNSVINPTQTVTPSQETIEQQKNETQTSKSIKTAFQHKITHEQYLARKHNWNPPSLNSLISSITAETQKTEAEQQTTQKQIEPGSTS